MAVKGPQCWGQRGGRSHRLPTPPTPREVVSLHSDYNPTPKTQRGFRGGTVVRRISPVGHEKIIRGTRDPDEKGAGPNAGRFLESTKN